MKKTLFSLFSSITVLLTLFSCSTNSDSFKQVWTGDPNYVSPENSLPEDAQNQSSGLDSRWWKSSSFYHIWVKSFYDSDGDGIGDLKGIEQKLAYIQNNVGCNAIWLSPIFQCSSTGKNMHGYDTINYYKVNSKFGTENELISLINAVHQRGMQIIFDFVPNHTSSNHPWFIKSSNNSEKRNWYIWSETSNTTNTGMSSDNWHYKNNSYYYGAFNGGMPDLNYYNYEVREEMKNVARYWLNKGFDGLRLDGARYLMENGTQGCDAAISHDWYKELRAELDKYSSPKFMICESWVTNNRNCLNSYLGNDNEFHMALDFDQGTRCITSVYNGYREDSNLFIENNSPDTAYGVFLGNHDEYSVYEIGGGSSIKLSSNWKNNAKTYIRFGQALRGDRKQINQSLALSILRPNVPFIYYGNEFGMKELAASGDMRARGSMNWDLANEQAASGISSLNFTKAANSLRKLYPKTFAYGTITEFPSQGTSKALIYRITGEDGDILFILNLGNEKEDTSSFTSDISVNNAAVIIGNQSAPALSSNGTAVTVSELGPRAIRVYDLTGTYSGSVLFNDDDYNETYTPENNTSKEVVISSQMYLKGSMLNNWSGSQQMIQYTENGDIVWKCTISLANGTYQFKFADTANWTGSDWGKGLELSGGITVASGNDGNLQFYASSSKQYTFIFNQSKQSASVE